MTRRDLLQSAIAAPLAAVAVNTAPVMATERVELWGVSLDRDGEVSMQYTVRLTRGVDKAYRWGPAPNGSEYAS